MQTFTDADGNVWHLAIDVDAVRRVRNQTGVDLWKIDEPAQIDRLTDAVTLCDVLWVLCQREARERSVDDCAFGRALRGDVLEHATNALLHAIVAFYPKAKGQLMDKAMAVATKLQSKAMMLAETTLDDPNLIDTILNDGASAPQG